ncbi:16S rRNA processing protein RimM [Pacificimonas sp. WHA3]|uniref:Ribosome maturation factor RimM n=1 Tax=Pacificimonas pallii TaxID=2827236 RepID=A0ABS6SCA4_9SPHN|nr:ribosome maturation factor RimM [Pacificimonas pallii]MBV7256048.1 16S rRNA processing protein RimM [Pacificimonas pallii]
MIEDNSNAVLLAAIIGAHGISGEVRLKLFADSEDSFAAFKTYDAGGRTLTLTSMKRAGKSFVARFKEIHDRTAAEALKGTRLTVDRDRLPEPGEGEVYAADLIGRSVGTPDGRLVGHIHAVENYGAGDILDIEKPDGKRFMLAFNADTVPIFGDNVTVDPDYLDEADRP